MNTAEFVSRDRHYAVFISYRHADNTEMGRKWANWLHEALESYEVPPDLADKPNLRGDSVPASLYPVFRDEEELPADADLSTNIRHALENSGLLVVICSPRAVASRFVADEIRYFKELGKSERILALMIDGEPNANDDPAKTGQFGPDAECFPEPLRFGVRNADGSIDWSTRTEPIAADVRPGGRPEQGWTTRAAYREHLRQEHHLARNQVSDAIREYAGQLDLAKLKIIAGALGVPLGELTQRDKAWQLQRAKRRSRILLGLSVLFALLALAACLAGWEATRSEKRARLAEGRAVNERNHAVGTLALSRHDRCVELVKAGNWRQAMTYCAGALRLEPQSPLYGRMAFSLLQNHAMEVPVETPWEGAKLLSVNFSRSGDLVALCNFGPSAILNFAGEGGRILQIPTPGSGMVIGASFSRQGALALGNDESIHLWSGPGRVGGPPQASVLAPMMTPVRGTPEEQMVAIYVPEATDLLAGKSGGTAFGVLGVFNAATGKRTWSIDVHQGKIIDAVQVPGSPEVVSVASDKTLAITDTARGAVTHHIPLSAMPRCVAVNEVSQLVAVGYEDARIQVMSLRDPSKTWNLNGFGTGEDQVSGLVFTHDGERLAAGFRGSGNTGRARIWDAASGEPLSQVMMQNSPVEYVTLDAGGDRLAAQGKNGEVGVYDSGGRLLSSWSSGATGNGLGFVRKGTQLAIASDDRRLQVFPTRTSPAAVAWAPLTAEATAVSVNDAAAVAVVVLDDGRSWQCWSPDSLRPLGPRVNVQGAALQSAEAVKGADVTWAVLVHQDGAVEVRTMDGRPVASRPGGHTLMETFAGLDASGLDSDEPVEINFNKGDSVALDGPRARLILGRLLLHPRKLKQVFGAGPVPASYEEGVAKWAKILWDPASGVINGEVAFLEIPTLKIVDTITASEGLMVPRLSADGKCCLARGTRSNRIYVWRIGGDGRWHEIAVPPPAVVTGSSTAAISKAELSPGARWVGIIGGNGAEVLDLDAMDRGWKPFAAGLQAVDLRFSPDDRFMVLEVSASDTAGSVQLWNLENGEPTSGILAHDGGMNAMEFSPDSSLLVTSGQDGTLRFWSTESGRAASEPIKTKGNVRAAAYARNGTVVLFGGADRRLSMCPVPPGIPAPDWVPGALESLGGARLDESGNVHAVSGAELAGLRAMVHKGNDAWGQMERYLWNEKGAVIPATQITAAGQAMTGCLERWKGGDHSSALALLREALRAHPDANVPLELKRLASFARLERAGFQTFENLDGRKAGTVKEDPSGIRFRWCPPGQFIMGSPASEAGRETIETPHQVILSRGFWISETEVTQGQWERVMGAPALEHMMRHVVDPTKFPSGSKGATQTCAQSSGLKSPEEFRTWRGCLGANRPMIFVTWNDSQIFCHRLNERMPPMEIDGFWSNRKPFRLPTEAEWEYACRAGTTTATYVGNPKYVGRNNASLLGTIAWYSGNSSDGYMGPGMDSSSWPEREGAGATAGVHPVATKAPNAWGVHDMLGNVAEWCQDSYRQYMTDDEVNPCYNVEDARRSVRGGSFGHTGPVNRAAHRFSDLPDWSNAFLGFRVVLLDGKETKDGASLRDPPSHSSKSDGAGRTFHFHYAGNNNDSGVRIWIREATDVWTENYPDRHQDRFMVIRDLVLDGNPGEVVRKQEKTGDQWRTLDDFEVFVPGVDAPRPRMWFRHGKDGIWGEWSFLTDVVEGRL